MKSKTIIFLLVLSLLIPVVATKAATTNDLKGRILLQVESKGEAWYVNPKDGKRYYMANGDQAFQIMKTLGVGMSNKDIDKMKKDATYRKKFIGKILLQVESKGEAYYISFDGRYNYLKDGASAYQVMRKLGLGVSNANLNKVVEYNTAKKVITQSSSQNKISTSTSTITVVKKDNTCSTDSCYKQLAISKNDSSICYNIKDHKNQGGCLVAVYVSTNKSDKNPCNILKGGYPELDADCKKLEAELNKTPTPRDIIVISDVKQIQTALSLYYQQNGKYPSEVVEGGKIGETMQLVPYAKKGETTNCSTNYQYKYSLINDNDYSLSYCIDERTNADVNGSNVKFNLGINYATPKNRY